MDFSFVSPKWLTFYEKKPGHNISLNHRGIIAQTRKQVWADSHRVGWSDEAINLDMGT